MRLLLTIGCLLAGFLMPQPLTAVGNLARIERKPSNLPGLKAEGEGASELSFEDRRVWKSVLRWCDECDDRANHDTGFSDCDDGAIAVYQIRDNQFLVDVRCELQINGSEHIYYKVTEHEDTLAIRLLHLEQFYFIREEMENLLQENPFLELEQKGSFIRFTDTLIFGDTFVFPEKPHQLHVLTNYRDSGGCGFLTVYDIGGDSPKVIEYRAKTFCSANYPPPEQWRSYRSGQRARWRAASNPLRKLWSSPKPACSK